MYFLREQQVVSRTIYFPRQISASGVIVEGMLRRFSTEAARLGPRTRARIAELDGWRGIAILLVVSDHLVNLRYQALLGVRSPYVGDLIGRWGVNMFFVISGFLITRLAIQEVEWQGHFSARAFYIRRAWRILPPFYLYLLTIAFFALAGFIAQRIEGVALAATFTCNLVEISKRCGVFTGHSWTLAFEEQFYLTFPLILYFGRKSVGRIFLALLIVLLSFPFVRLALHVGEGWAAGMAVSFSFIAMGAVVASYENKFEQLVTSSYSRLLCVAATVMLVMLFVADGFLKFPLGSNSAYVQLAISILLLPPVLAWTVLSGVYRRGLLTPILKSRLLQFVGAISYSLYIWQQPFTVAPSNYLVSTWLEFPPLMLVGAIFSYYVLERPCIKLGKWLVNGRRSPLSELPARLAE